MANIKYTFGTTRVPIFRPLVNHHVIVLSSSNEDEEPVVSVQPIASV